MCGECDPSGWGTQHATSKDHERGHRLRGGDRRLPETRLHDRSSWNADHWDSTDDAATEWGISEAGYIAYIHSRQSHLGVGPKRPKCYWGNTYREKRRPDARAKRGNQHGSCLVGKHQRVPRWIVNAGLLVEILLNGACIPAYPPGEIARSSGAIQCGNAGGGGVGLPRSIHRNFEEIFG